MDKNTVRQALIEVLESIQSTSHLSCPLINDATRPIEDLEKFDSKMWPVAATMLARALGCDIPRGLNIFRKSRERVPLTIEETVRIVCQLAFRQTVAESTTSVA